MVNASCIPLEEDVEMSEERSTVPWALPVERVFDQLETDPRMGLTLEESTRRLKASGLNMLKQKEETLLERILEPFREPMMILLLVTAGLFVALAEFIDAVALLIIISIMAAVEIYQERRTESSIKSLRLLTLPSTIVIRSGQHLDVLSSAVVPGDVVILSAGHRVPADARLIESFDLSLDESSLTGESMPSYKDAAVLLPEHCALGDRRNMAFSGTLVTTGRGKAIVVGTGSGTELGRIASLTESIHEKPTPLQVRISELTRLIAVTVIALTAATAAVGLLRGQSLVDSALIGLSLLVVTIPEDLPILTFVILVTAVIQMAKKKALIRKLYSAETLGSTTTICSDKTGTITENKMKVSMIYANGASFDSSDVRAGVPQGTLSLLAKVATFCNDSVPQNDAKLPVVGNPVDVALITLVERVGFQPRSIRETGQLLHEEPFDNKRKMMLSVHRMKDQSVFVSTKGAPEVIIGRCSSLRGPTRELPMTDEDRRELLHIVLKMSSNGLRVLALAYKDLPPQALTSQDEYYSGWGFVGLVGFEDPPRPEVKAAIAECKRAGIRTIMVTGDHANTALSIAKAVELTGDDQIITGEELDGISDDQLSGKLVDVSVFARVTPEHKLRIVRALKARGEVVAVTGDGVNDAPALREADIGAAMGSGTDVAKEAASMTLADDNFTTIVTAVREGRRLFDNLRKAIRYYLPSKIGILMTVFFSLLVGAGTPLTPLQIILMEVVNDIQASTTFATEPSEADIMSRPPRGSRERIITAPMSLQIFSRAFAIFLGALAVFLLYVNGGGVLDKARTMVFVNIMISLTLLALFSRSEKSPFHRLGVRSNSYMLYILLLSVLTIYLVTVLEPLQLVFNTTALNPWDWLIAVSLSVLATGWIEAGKIISSLRGGSSDGSGSRTSE